MLEFRTDEWFEVILDNISNGFEQKFVFLIPSSSISSNEDIWISEEFRQLDINCQDHTTINKIRNIGIATCVKEYDKYGYWKWAVDNAEEDKSLNDLEDKLNESKKLLTAANSALHSYQYGNSSPILAIEVSERIEEFLNHGF